MEVTKLQTFSEIYCLLKYFPESYIDKLPKELLGLIEQNSNPEYYIEVDTTKPLEEQDISENTKNTLVVFKYNYWSDEIEKKDIIEQLNRNENKYQEEIRKKYDSDNIFKPKEIETEKSSVALVEYKKSIFTRIKNWLKQIFNI